jgi:hypothetical protein
VTTVGNRTLVWRSTGKASPAAHPADGGGAGSPARAAAALAAATTAARSASAPLREYQRAA